MYDEGDIKTINGNQEDSRLQLSLDDKKHYFEDQILIETEVQSKPPISIDKNSCLHKSHDQFGFVKLGTESICMICKKIIHVSGSDPCNKNHLSSNEHKLNQSELFKQCFNDLGKNSSNKIYNYMLSNSFIDFSSATEISTDKVNVICFVCKYELSPLTRSEDVLVDDLLLHLKDENHIRNLQDNFTWTCNLPLKGYFTFYKTLFYCSLCDESIRSCDDLLIQSAVNHVETKNYENYTSHGFDLTIFLEHKTSYDSDSTASNISSGSERVEIDLYSNWDDESIFFEDDACATNACEVNLPLAENNQEEFLYLCVECGENIEMVDNDFELSMQLHSINHEKQQEGCGEKEHLGLPTQKSYGEHIVATIKEQVESFDNHCSPNNSHLKEIIEYEQKLNKKTSDEHKIKEMSIINADKNICEGHENEDQKQINSKQKFPIQTKNSFKNNFFSDLSDCLPCNFHKDLTFVTIKSNHLYCELCIHTVGIVLNVFDSSFILYNHFSSTYHKNKMDGVSERKNENVTSKRNQSLSNNNKDREENSYEKKKLTSNEINQIKHFPVGNLLANGSSLNNVIGKLNDLIKTFSNEQTLNTHKQNELSYHPNNLTQLNELSVSNISSTSCSAQKQTTIDSISNNATIQVQKQTELYDISSNTPTDEVIVVSNSSSLVTSSQTNTFETETGKLNPSISSSIANLLNDSTLRVHQEFFQHKCNTIFCCLCSSDVRENQADLKDHISGIKHKVKFLALLKKHLKESQRNQVKFLLFINGQLYCSVCKCYAAPWTHFLQICQGVAAHFEMGAHSDVDVDEKLKLDENY